MKHSIWLVLLLRALWQAALPDWCGLSAWTNHNEKCRVYAQLWWWAAARYNRACAGYLGNTQATDGTPVKAGFFCWPMRLMNFGNGGFITPHTNSGPAKASIAKYPKIARRIKQAGHTIGNHTTHHAWFRWPWLDTNESVLSELTEWEVISKRVLGASNKRLFRPPYYILTKTCLKPLAD